MQSLFLFGGTGDLSLKKLYPALLELDKQVKFDKTTRIICIGRRDFTDALFHQFIMDQQLNPSKEWESFVEKLHYVQVRFEVAEDYNKLATFQQIDPQEIAVFYLATAPQYFEVIVEKLNHSSLLEKGNTNHRVVIEKPFGNDLKSAVKINNHMKKFLDESQIYRMDHYLGKEMIQNIMMLRFSNVLFEASWNHTFIDYVEISVSESSGVFERAAYYDKTGAIRDMVQSHLLQMLALIAMTPDKDSHYGHLCDAKVNILKNLKIQSVEEDIVIGQYVSNGFTRGYREENGVSPTSMTETFAAITVQIDVPRWKGVNFYLKTGKGLSHKASEITIVYKRPPGKYGQTAPANKLTIEVDPKEGMSLQFNMKEPRTVSDLITREMAFCQSCMVDYNSPMAYETLIHEVLVGSHDLYARWDEVKYAWVFIEQILSQCEDIKSRLVYYPVGSDGPELRIRQ